MFYFSFAATGRWLLKSSPRSQNHAIWNQQKYILWHYERSVRDVMIMTMIIIVIITVFTKIIIVIIIIIIFIVIITIIIIVIINIYTKVSKYDNDDIIGWISIVII